MSLVICVNRIDCMYELPLKYSIMSLLRFHNSKTEIAKIVVTFGLLPINCWVLLGCLMQTLTPIDLGNNYVIVWLVYPKKM